MKPSRFWIRQTGHISYLNQTPCACACNIRAWSVYLRIYYYLLSLSFTLSCLPKLSFWECKAKRKIIQKYVIVFHAIWPIRDRFTFYRTLRYRIRDRHATNVLPREGNWEICLNTWHNKIDLIFYWCTRNLQVAVEWLWWTRPRRVCVFVSTALKFSLQQHLHNNKTHECMWHIFCRTSTFQSHHALTPNTIAINRRKSRDNCVASEKQLKRRKEIAKTDKYRWLVLGWLMYLRLDVSLDSRVDRWPINKL